MIPHQEFGRKRDSSDGFESVDLNDDGRDLPRHVAVIMDGNGRWATMREKSRVEGHSRGAEVLRDIVRWSQERGLAELTCYALSTENFQQRPSDEVDSLLNLLGTYLKSEREELDRLQVCFRVIGRTAELPEETQVLLQETVDLTRQNDNLVLRLAVNYGGRAELEDAARLLRSSSEFTSLGQCLYEPEMSDVDLLIRSGGEKRFSNFLPWQLTYSELYFTPVLWPDFSEKEFDLALGEYSSRSRRFGRLPNREAEAE